MTQGWEPRHRDNAPMGSSAAMNIKRYEGATSSWWANTSREELQKRAEAELERMSRSRETRLVMPTVVGWGPRVSGGWR